MTTRDEVLAMAEQAGARPIYERTNRLPGVLTIDADALKRFYALAFEAGRKAEREELIGLGWRSAGQIQMIIERERDEAQKELLHARSDK